jgi:hypothetical protein
MHRHRPSSGLGGTTDQGLDKPGGREAADQPAPGKTLQKGAV